MTTERKALYRLPMAGLEFPLTWFSAKVFDFQSRVPDEVERHLTLPPKDYVYTMWSLPDSEVRPIWQDLEFQPKVGCPSALQAAPPRSVLRQDSVLAPPKWKRWPIIGRGHHLHRWPWPGQIWLAKGPPVTVIGCTDPGCNSIKLYVPKK